MSRSTSDVKASVQRQFGNVAANYAVSSVHKAGKDLDAMLEAAALNGTEKVLDAGCGAGHAALAFAHAAAHVTALDFTPAMLEQVNRLAAERGIHNVQTQEGDVENLPFEDAQFDLVISRYSAHHWPHPQQAVREFARVLKPGGRFILDDVVASEVFTQDTFLQVIEVLRDPSHVRDFRLSEWQSMLADAGFQSDVVLKFDVTLNFLDWTQRMATPPENAAMIRTLLADVADEVQTAFHLREGWQDDDNFEFVIPGAVIVGTAP